MLMLLLLHQEVSNFSGCMCASVCVHGLCVQRWLCASRTIAGPTDLLPGGRRSSWTDGVTGSAQNHSPGSGTETEAQAEVSELKGASGSQRNIQTKTPEKNELLPDHWSCRAADCD